MCPVPSDSMPDGFIELEWLSERCVKESAIKYPCTKYARALKKAHAIFLN